MVASTESGRDRVQSTRTLFDPGDGFTDRMKVNDRASRRGGNGSGSCNNGGGGSSSNSSGGRNNSRAGGVSQRTRNDGHTQGNVGGGAGRSNSRRGRQTSNASAPSPAQLLVRPSGLAAEGEIISSHLANSTSTTAQHKDYVSDGTTAALTGTSVPATALKTSATVEETAQQRGRTKFPASGTPGEAGQDGFRKAPRHVKLLGDTLSFNEASASVLKDIPTDFLVVGVLGPTGAGKSAIMSMLYNTSNGEQTAASDNLPDVFPVQNDFHMLNAKHATVGVDMTVTDARMILLDSQPVMSTSVLDALSRARDSTLPFGLTSHMQWAMCQDLELAVYLLSVCDVVLVTEEWSVNVPFIRFLKAAADLQQVVVKPPKSGKPSTPSGGSNTSPATVASETIAASSSASGRAGNNADVTEGTAAAEGSTLAQVMFVMNQCLPGFDQPSHSELISNMFKDSQLVTSRTDSVDREGHHVVVNNTKGGYRCYYLPPKDSVDPQSGKDKVWDSITASLRDDIFECVRWQAWHTSNGRQQLSEINWWQRARRTWTDIRASRYLKQYAAGEDRR